MFRLKTAILYILQYITILIAVYLLYLVVSDALSYEFLNLRDKLIAEGFLCLGFFCLAMIVAYWYKTFLEEDEAEEDAKKKQTYGPLLSVKTDQGSIAAPMVNANLRDRDRDKRERRKEAINTVIHTFDSVGSGFDLPTGTPTHGASAPTLDGDTDEGFGPEDDEDMDGVSAHPSKLSREDIVKSVKHSFDYRNTYKRKPIQKNPPPPPPPSGSAPLFAYKSFYRQRTTPTQITIKDNNEEESTSSDYQQL